MLRRNLVTTPVTTVIRGLIGALVAAAIAALAGAAFLMAAGCAEQAHCAGLKTTFVKVSLGNLRPGGSYNIREMANLPLAVYNTGDAPVGLEVEATVPVAGEIREGYQPIPDAAWVSFGQGKFEGIEPGRAALTDVVISIPDDPQYLGKRYQVMIWSHTVGGGFVACGLKSEVLFTTSTTAEAPPKAIGLLPTEIIIPDVEAGKPFRVTLEISNPYDEDKTVAVGPVAVADSPLQIKDGYLEWLDPAALELDSRTVVVPGHGQRSLGITVRLAEDSRNRGKSYMFAVAAAGMGSNATAAYSAVYVNLK